MPRNYYLIAGIVYFCSNLIILFASICESTTQYKLAYPYPPGYTPVVLTKPHRALDLEYFYPHHLDLPPAMKENPTAPPLPNVPPTQDFSKLRIPTHLAYLEFTLKEILIYNPEAIIKETKTISREETWVTIPPLLFRNKYNYLPAYLVLMTPPLTLQPNCLQKSVATNESTSTQIFGVMYITLTSLIDSMLPASSPWALLGKLVSCIVNLAPIW
ncbi:hypothetical protein DSO57_1012230 [Entomophthora muscae]|uniref:Uncharacterized protein n=1 Tax=Entomophthora muscae TaxID=34485 RepID=A0ACC2RKZ5_9FUNG|nr:hypothetical protein DSO57_1012230 [Entomophthora muscae]